MPSDAQAQVERLAGRKPDAIAICLLHSYINPVHERMLADFVRKRLPGVYVALSSDVWPEYREFERASTTVASAYVGPMVADYVQRLHREIRRAGITGSFQIMQSNGGVMSATVAAQKAIYSVESGPAAGVIAAAHLGRLLGHPDIVSFDMGGTTAKAGVIRGGQPSITNDFRVGGRVSIGGRSTGAANQDTGRGSGRSGRRRRQHCLDRLRGRAPGWPAQRRARRPAPPATALAVSSPRSPTPTWCWATSIPIISWAEE